MNNLGSLVSLYASPNNVCAAKVSFCTIYDGVTLTLLFDSVFILYVACLLKVIVKMFLICETRPKYLQASLSIDMSDYSYG